MRKPLILLTFALVLLLGVFHQVGSMFYLYWSLPWFDNVAHFLGGLAIGVLSIWVIYGLILRSTPSSVKVMLTTIFSVLIIGVGWEIFEHIYGIANPTGGNYVTDTTHDLIADTLGAILAGIIGRLKKLYA